MIELMDMVYITIKMELNTKEIGMMINNMVKEKKNGQMGLFMKEIIKTVRKKEEVNLFGMTELHILVSSVKIIFMVDLM